jgi:hypothetical protein
MRSGVRGGATYPSVLSSGELLPSAAARASRRAGTTALRAGTHPASTLVRNVSEQLAKTQSLVFGI